MEPLKGAVVGVMVQDAAGHVLASREPGRRMVPASNLKLVTTGTALHALGPDFRFQTGIGYTGTVEDGTLHGDVYIIGGGDPTLGVTDTVAVKPDALFWRWKSMLKDAGISRIDGRIIGDGRAYEGHLENTTWGYDDTGTYYGAGCNALSYYENAIDYLVSAGAADEPVKVTQRFPDTPWMHFSNRTSTGPKGTGNSLYLYTTDLAPYAEMRGTYSIDRKPKLEHFANKYGALTCAYYFWQNLRDLRLLLLAEPPRHGLGHLRRVCRHRPRRLCPGRGLRPRVQGRRPAGARPVRLARPLEDRPADERPQ